MKPLMMLLIQRFLRDRDICDIVVKSYVITDRKEITVTSSDDRQLTLTGELYKELKVEINNTITAAALLSFELDFNCWDYKTY